MIDALADRGRGGNLSPLEASFKARIARAAQRDEAERRSVPM